MWYRLINVFDGTVEQCTMQEWAEGPNGYVKLAHTHVTGSGHTFLVSTIFGGISSVNDRQGRPTPFVTAILPVEDCDSRRVEDGEPRIGKEPWRQLWEEPYEHRHATMDDAKTGHEQAVKWITELLAELEAGCNMEEGDSKEDG